MQTQAAPLSGFFLSCSFCYRRIQYYFIFSPQGIRRFLPDVFQLIHVKLPYLYRNYTIMKRFLLFGLLFPLLVMGQEQTISTIPAPASPGRKLHVPKLMKRQDALILRLGLDNWTNLPKGVETNLLGSRGFGLLVMGEKMNAKNRIGAAFGFGLSSHRVDHNAVALTDTDGVGTVLTPLSDSVDYQKNRFVLNSLDAAFEIRFRGNPDKHQNHFKFSLGFRAGYVVQSHLKFKDDRVKYKDYSIEDIQRWRYGVTARIGFGNFAVDGYYSLAPLFKDGKGPVDMMPYSIGIAWTI